MVWNQSDKTIPRGSIGTVEGPSSQGDEFVQVKFPGGLFRFPVAQLKLATDAGLSGVQVRACRVVISTRVLALTEFDVHRS